MMRCPTPNPWSGPSERAFRMSMSRVPWRSFASCLGNGNLLDNLGGWSHESPRLSRGLLCEATTATPSASVRDGLEGQLERELNCTRPARRVERAVAARLARPGVAAARRERAAEVRVEPERRRTGGRCAECCQRRDGVVEVRAVEKVERLGPQF